MTSTTISLLILAGVVGLSNLGIGLLLLIFHILTFKERKTNSALYLSFTALCLACINGLLSILVLFPENIILSSVFLASTQILGNLVPVFFLFFAWTYPSFRIPYSVVYVILFVYIGGLILTFLPEVGSFVYTVEGLDSRGSYTLFSALQILQTFILILLGPAILLYRGFTQELVHRAHIFILAGGYSIMMVIGLVIFVVNIYLDNTLLQITPFLLELAFVTSSAYVLLKESIFSVPASITQILIIIVLSFGSLFMQIMLFSLGLQTYLAPIFILFGIFLILDVLLIKRIVEEVDERRTLEQKQYRLKTLAQEKDRFLRTSSHQLRTPLTALEGYMSLVKEETQQSPAETRHVTNNLYLLTQRMQSLVQQLLSFNSLQTGTFEITQHQAIDLYTLLTEINQTETAIENIYDSVHFSIYGTKGDYIIQGDRPKLKAALSNIVHNALTYTENLVTITLSHTNSHIEIHIEDNGIGITEAEHKILFEQFERGEKASQRNPDGSGLGLYLAKQIIELHDGTISFESKGRSEGTTVHITLPSQDT